MQTRILTAEDTIRCVLFCAIFFTYSGTFYNLQNTLSHTKKVLQYRFLDWRR